MSKQRQRADNIISLNKKAHYNYFIKRQIEAGIALQGWEVKSLRNGKLQIGNSYILLKKGEAFLFGALITPLPSASTHISPDPQRTRKLLLHQREINSLIGAVEHKGLTVVPISMYWKKGRAKLKIALASGKKAYDKRENAKKRDWQREKNRQLKSSMQ